MSYPYLARTTLKYKSPHATDLSFAKDERIRVTGPSPDDDDWLAGETLDGSKSGGFPKDFVTPIEDEDEEPATGTAAAAATTSTTTTEPVETESAVSTEEHVTVESATEENPPASPIAPVPPSPKQEPAALPPSASSTPTPPPTSTPAAAAAAVAPAPAPAQPAVGGDTTSSPHQSMKDRLAFFNAAQTKAAPPPPVKSKPAASGLTWSQRQKLRQEQEAKDHEAGGGGPPPSNKAPLAPSGSSEPSALPTTSAPSATATPSDTPAQASTESAESKERSGMSAADAASSIGQGGSLKERMAALRAGGAFGQPEEPKPVPPKPSGKVWLRPPAPPEPEPEPEPETEGGGEEGTAVEKVKTPVGEGGNVLEGEGKEGGEEEEETEEEKEKAKRAAIAARMAKLGARGPMGMLPPKPTRKPTREATSTSTSPAEEKVEPTAITEDKMSQAEQVPNVPAPSTKQATSPPTSVPIPAVPRRAAPPRRRGPALSSNVPTATTAREDPPEPENRFEKIDAEGNIQPPPPVMVADEEPPIPKTEEQLASEKEQERAGAGERGAEGAVAAGIALMPTDDVKAEDHSAQQEPMLVGSVGGADREATGMAVVKHEDGGIVNDEDKSQEVEEGINEGGAEHDEIMGEFAKGGLGPQSPEEKMEPIAMVPLHPPAEDESTTMSEKDDDDVPPPPPPRMTGLPKDEVEMKHDHDAVERQQADLGRREHNEVAEKEEEDDNAPIPPSRSAARPVSMDKPSGPRPKPSPGKQERSLPAPPTGHEMVPPRDEEEEDRELEGEGDVESEEEAASAPPPPRRQPSMPTPIQIGVPTLATAQKLPPTARSTTSPSISRSPPRMATSPTPAQYPATMGGGPASVEAGPGGEPEPTEEDEEKKRKAGIAARMAKLGGIKFGMPPPVPTFKKRASTSEESHVREEIGSTGPLSPVNDQPRMNSPLSEVPPNTESGPMEGDEETPEAEATRRRATLARLRAGGSLGYGLFDHGPKSSQAAEDKRGLEEEKDEQPPPVPAGRPQAPPPPPPPPPVEEEDEDAPPPPNRPTVPLGRSQSTNVEDEAPPYAPPARPQRASTQEVAPSPNRSSSANRPAVRITGRGASQIPPASPIAQTTPAVSGHAPSRSGEFDFTDEPAIMMMNQASPNPNAASLPPPPPSGRPGPGVIVPPIQTQPMTTPERTVSTASRASRGSVEMQRVGASPMSRQQPGRQGSSLSQGHPGYNELQQASKESGSRLARAARGMFDQGKKAYYGDGSPVGFVLTAMDNAHLTRPQQSWGQVVYEQEASSVVKRYDEPRPGDIAAFHDAKFKGRKGLQSYDQHVGSVEEPLVGVVIDFEVKNKHKMKVLQVEGGQPEEVSYRCDDLKSGRVLVYRPGL